MKTIVRQCFKNTLVSVRCTVLLFYFFASRVLIQWTQFLRFIHCDVLGLLLELITGHVSYYITDSQSEKGQTTNLTYWKQKQESWDKFKGVFEFRSSRWWPDGSTNDRRLTRVNHPSRGQQADCIRASQISIPPKLPVGNPRRFYDTQCDCKA